MKKKNKNASQNNSLIYFNKYEETVIRSDETQKNEIFGKFKKERLLNRVKTAVCFISAFAILLSGSYLVKRGIEKFIVISNEEKMNDTLTIPENLSKKFNQMDDEARWAYLYEQYPDLINTKFPAGILIDYALFYAENPQTIGYLKIDGTEIDTPVVQADNNKYYLTHDFNGNSTAYGAIYASYIADFKPFDRNTLIYGHRMNDGRRFGPLRGYKELEFFKEHPVIEFNSLFEKHKWKICSVFLTDGSVNKDDGYFFDFTFDNCSDACYMQYIDEIKKRSLYETGVDIQLTDKLITLCTCSHDFDNARLIVVARMVRDGESENVDLSLATYKKTPVKYPADYYKDSKKDPYKDDEKWYLF